MIELTEKEVSDLVKKQEIEKIHQRIRKIAWKEDEWKKFPGVMIETMVDSKRLAEFLWEEMS